MKFNKFFFVSNVFIAFHILVGAENQSSVSPEIVYILRTQYITLFNKYMNEVFDAESENIFKNDSIVRFILPGIRCYSQVDPYGNSLLHYAVNQQKDKSSRLIKFLLEHEQSLHAKNKAGFTPACIARTVERYDSLEILTSWASK